MQVGSENSKPEPDLFLKTCQILKPEPALFKKWVTRPDPFNPFFKRITRFHIRLDLTRFHIYSDGTATVAAASPATPFGEDAGEAAAPPLLVREGSSSLPRSIGIKTVEEVWREISGGRKADGGGDGSGYKDATAVAATTAYGEMTLEDFLARTGAVREEDVRVPLGSAALGGFGVDVVMNDRFGQQQAQLPLENPMLGFGNGVEAEGGGGGRGGRGRKRPVLDPVDRVALQRQKRMIKNRESAARSREGKLGHGEYAHGSEKMHREV